MITSKGKLIVFRDQNENVTGIILARNPGEDLGGGDYLVQRFDKKGWRLTRDTCDNVIDENTIVALMNTDNCWWVNPDVVVSIQDKVDPEKIDSFII